MFSNSIRLSLVLAAIIAAAATYLDSRTRAALFVFGAVMLSIGYFRHSTVWLAFQAQRNGQSERSRKLLGQVANPDGLSRQNRAYYYLLQGIHAIEAEEFAVADHALARAELRFLRTDNDRSMATALRGVAAIGLGDLDRVHEYLEAAKRIPHRPEIAAHIEKLEDEMAKRRNWVDE